MYKTLTIVFFLFPFFVKAQLVNNSDENKVFEKIEIEAGFPGGLVKWKEFVKKNFNFTRVEKNLPDSISRFSETANIQFIVDKNGIIKDLSFQNGVTKAVKESCTELFRNSPHWQPASQCGRNVSVYRKETFIV
jgi:protein TonB